MCLFFVKLRIKIMYIKIYIILTILLYRPNLKEKLCFLFWFNEL